MSNRTVLNEKKMLFTSFRHFQNPLRFRVPRVQFSFHYGVSESLARRLERRGVTVRGQRLNIGTLKEEDSSEDSDSDSEYEQEDSDVGSGEEAVFEEVASEIDSSCLNLDITAMIAYVSALTNGYADYEFKEPILTEQVRGK